MIELEADLLDVPRLLVAEQIAGTANVEIVAGELESCPEAVEIDQHLQALLRRFGDRPVRRHCEIGVSARFRAADAAAELIQLSEPEAVGTIDDERVGRRDVEPALHDAG